MSDWQYGTRARTSAVQTHARASAVRCGLAILTRVFSVRARTLAALTLAVLAASATPALAQQRLAHALGEFEFLPSSSGIVIAAPHGTYDAGTAALAIDIAQRLGAGYLVARRFSVEGTRINVNRPTEGAGRPCAEEVHSPRAREVFEAYVRLLAMAAQGRALKLYVEIHGNGDARSAQRIEVATVGVSTDEARQAKAVYPVQLGRIRARSPAFPDLDLTVEPHDALVFNARCAKEFGVFIMDPVRRVLHIELPRSTRDAETSEATAQLLSEVVREFESAR